MITSSFSTPSTFCSRARCSLGGRARPGGELRLVVPAPALPPAGQRVRVVGRGVQHRVGAPVDVRDTGDDVHAGQADLLAERDHVRRDVAEILEDQRQAAEPLAGRVEERDSGPLAPESLRGVVLVERQLPELHEAAEVVDPQQVEQLELALEPRQPPGIALCRVGRPVEHRHAPALALRMIQRRCRTGDHRAIEEAGVRQRIARVAGHVERDVSDQPDPTLVRVSLQGQPLPLKPCLRPPLGFAREAASTPRASFPPVRRRHPRRCRSAETPVERAGPRSRRTPTATSTAIRARPGCAAAAVATRPDLLRRASPRRRTRRRPGSRTGAT